MEQVFRANRARLPTPSRCAILAWLLCIGCAGPIATTRTREPMPPSPLMPPARARIGSHRPGFLWQLAPGSDGARLEICRDAACSDIVATVDALGTAANAPVDLPLGPLFWRLRGRVGDRIGAVTTPARPFLIDVRVTFSGRHVTVTVPEDEPRLGQQLITLGDQALERYASVLGAELPRESIPVTIFVTDTAMDAIMQSARDPHHVVGLTHPDGSVEFHLPLLGGPSPALSEGVGAYEWTFLHELAHAFRHRTMPNSHDQPVWIQEGLADRLAECILGGDDVPLSTIARARVDPFKKALGTIQRIPVAKLLTTTERELHEDDAKTFTLYYSESYYLNRYLDSGDRRGRFRALLTEVGRMPRALLPTRLASRVRELFGDLAALDRALEASLRAEPEPPWVAIAGDVRPLNAGAVALVSVRGGTSSALIRHGPGSLKQVSAVVDLSDAKQVSLFVIARSPNGQSTFPRDFCKVVFGSESPVQLQCWGGKKWEMVARGETLRARVGPRKLQVELSEGKVRIKVDDELVLEATIDKALAIGPSGGAVGVGVDDGRAVFHDVRVE